MSTLRIAGGRVLLPDMTVTEGDVLVDQDSGTILEVGGVRGSSASASRPDADASGGVGEGDETLDATGSLVMPGLVNAHTHAAMTLLRGYSDDKPLETWLREDIWPAEAELTPEDIRAGTELALVEMIRSGTTAFADMYFEVPEIAEVVEAAGVRARLGHGVVTVGKEAEDARADLDTSIEMARRFDGAAGGRIRTAFMPHSLTTVGEEYLREYVPKAREAGVPIHYHANETEHEVTPIVEEYDERPLSYAEDLDLTGPDDFVAHGVHLDAEEIHLLAEAGTAVIHCPASNTKLASGMAPVQAMLDAGVTVGIGTDGAASNNDLDMFDELRDAAMIGKLAADDPRAVDAETAVEMATAGSAAALGFESGRIEAGANADIAVVDMDVPHLTPNHDPVSNLAYAARGSDVRHTVCDGRVLMADRELRTLDEERIRREAGERAFALVDRAG